MRINKCRACNGKLTLLMDLGEQYLSDFRDDNSKPPLHPLVVVICEDCKLVQLKHTVPSEEMYHERYGFKSGINDNIIIDLDDIVTHAFQYVNDPHSWLDIASNDGTLLSFVPSNVNRVGFDPVEFLCVEAEQHANLIINDYFKYMDVLPKFDIITSISCFYDMPDPSKFVRDVERSLSTRGVWVIQQNYLLPILQLKAIDNFCHEHLEYYSLYSLERLLERFNLEVNEVYLSNLNGGVIRTMVSHKGTFPIDESVFKQRLVESDYGIENIEVYKDFANGLNDNITKLRNLLIDIKLNNQSIAILAASTRGAVIWQAADIANLIDYAVERNPAKVGKYFSALGIPIISEEEALKRMPDFQLVGPWFFANSIIDRSKDYLDAGGHLIMPLPEVIVI